MKKQLKHIILLIVILAAGLSACRKEHLENESTLKILYKDFREGSISECKYNGQTVYLAGLNAYDAGSVIYDKDGNLIGTCNYAWGTVDLMCSELTESETIYCVKNNIWGQPAVDKYGLASR